jgi:hypothetical protein
MLESTNVTGEGKNASVFIDVAFVVETKYLASYASFTIRH